MELVGSRMCRRLVAAVVPTALAEVVAAVALTGRLVNISAGDKAAVDMAVDMTAAAAAGMGMHTAALGTAEPGSRHREVGR